MNKLQWPDPDAAACKDLGRIVGELLDEMKQFMVDAGRFTNWLKDKEKRKEICDRAERRWQYVAKANGFRSLDDLRLVVEERTTSRWAAYVSGEPLGDTITDLIVRLGIVEHIPKERRPLLGKFLRGMGWEKGKLTEQESINLAIEICLSQDSMDSEVMIPLTAAILLASPWREYYDKPATDRRTLLIMYAKKEQNGHGLYMYLLQRIFVPKVKH